MESFFIIGGDGHEYGPASLEEILQWAAEGRVTPTTSVRTDVRPEWVAAARWPELREALGNIPPGTGGEPAARSPGRMPFDGRNQSLFTAAVLIQLCCCVPCGIVAVARATQAEVLEQCGRLEEAADHGRRAWWWIKMGLVGWVVFLLGMVLLNVLGLTLEKSSSVLKPSKLIRQILPEEKTGYPAADPSE